MDQQPAPSFEPVLLNLGDDADYAIVVNAFDEWAGRLEHDAEDEDQRIRDNQLPDSDSDSDAPSVEANSYEDARELLYAQVPEGYDLIAIRTDNGKGNG